MAELTIQEMNDLLAELEPRVKQCARWRTREQRLSAERGAKVRCGWNSVKREAFLKWAEPMVYKLKEDLARREYPDVGNQDARGVAGDET